MTEVLFEIGVDRLDTGLRGYPVGTVRSSSVDPQTGVRYVGVPIDQLADFEPEKVMYLLLRKHFPEADELASFKNELISRSRLPEGVLELLKGLPQQSHPMDWLISGILYLGMFESPTGNYEEDGLRLVARVPEVVAAIFRIRSGWGDPIPSKPELGYVENFVHMLGAPDASPHLDRLLRSFNVLHYDHGGGNLSTFTGKAVASGLANIYTSMASAMAALGGPLHGRANQNALEFVREIGTDDPESIRAFVMDCLEKKRVIPGFGHGVLRAEDPRARVLYGIGEEICPEDPLFRVIRQMREVVPSVLSENPKIQNPYPNVDAATGTLLQACGLKDPEYYTVLFGWSRVVGITAQIIDERTVARSGKGAPIYRPKYVPVDQPHRDV